MNDSIISAKRIRIKHLIIIAATPPVERSLVEFVPRCLLIAGPL